MKKYPNYRVAVEVVIIKGSKVLLTKRAGDCLVAPNKWCVPAGKVKYEEIPIDACVREAKEEVQLDVNVLKEIGVRAFKGEDSKGEFTYRLVYTYMVNVIGEHKEPIIDEEHSEFCWVTKEELDGLKFNTIDETLRRILKEHLD